MSLPVLTRIVGPNPDQPNPPLKAFGAVFFSKTKHKREVLRNPFLESVADPSFVVESNKCRLWRYTADPVILHKVK
jgi:hypothetical protein